MTSPHMSPEQEADRRMLESELKAEVLKLAAHHGWKVQHLSHEPRHAHRSGGKGFPDLVLARAGTVHFAELKREDESPDAAQVEWHLALGGAHVWRPSDLREGLIHRVLA